MDTSILPVNSNNSPSHRPFDASRFNTLVLGQMFAYATIVPMETSRITLLPRSRNKDMLRWHIENDVLMLEDVTSSRDTVEFGLIMPTRINLQIDELIGKVDINDHLDATLAFNISRDTEVRADTVANLGGTASNFSRVEVARVREVINVTATGAAEVIIKGGWTRQLRAKAFQGGTVHHRGGASDAELRAADSRSLVTVARVTG